MQLTRLALTGNRLSGTLPSSWAGLHQASHGAAYEVALKRQVKFACGALACPSV